MSDAVRSALIERPIFLVGPPNSGAGLLFDLLSRVPGMVSVGKDVYGQFDAIESLASRRLDSDRLDSRDADDETIATVRELYADAIATRATDSTMGGTVRMLEWTPRNALRVSFLAKVFPDATFVDVYRDPRESISTTLDGWRSGHFVTHPDLPGWSGLPWSFLLVPGWQELSGRPTAEVVVQQWTRTVDVVLDDLWDLSPEKWCVASFDDLLADPVVELRRLCSFLGLPSIDDAAEELGRTGSADGFRDPERWRRNRDLVVDQVSVFGPTADRARRVFATKPSVKPIEPPTFDSADAVAMIRPVTPVFDGDGRRAMTFTARHDEAMHELLDENGISLAIAMGRSNALLIMRSTIDGVDLHLRALDAPMALASDGRRLAIGLRGEVIVFRDQPDLASRVDSTRDLDACFAPRVRQCTGDIGVRALAWGDEGLWVVATRFNCLATLDDEHSFVPRWRPAFLSALTAEDRCHLSGVAMIDGAPAYATVFGMTDDPEGWRAIRADGGAILEISSNAPVVTGLSMPQSPHWHDDGLWVLESGRGALVVVDPDTGSREDVIRLRGFARGLVIAGHYAFVGLSRSRDGSSGRRDEVDRCGVCVIDTVTGAEVASLTIDGAIGEVADLALLPCRFPELLEPGSPLAESGFVLPGAGSVPPLR